MVLSEDGNIIKEVSFEPHNPITKRNFSNIVSIQKFTASLGTESTRFYIVVKRAEAFACGISKRTYKNPWKKRKWDQLMKIKIQKANSHKKK